MDDGASPLRRVRLGAAGIAHRVSGDVEGRPTVLLVHGSWEDHHTWDRVAALLARTCRVVAYDRRGHSASTAPAGQGRIGEDVDDAAALVEHLGVGPVSVVGHSFGATVALMLAGRHPRLVERVVVHEPQQFGVLSGDDEWGRVRVRVAATMADVAAGLEAGDLETAVRLFVDEVAFGPHAWTDLFDDRTRATALANADTWLDQFHDPDRLAVDLGAVAAAGRPIALTSGADSLPWYPEIARRVARTVGAVRVELPGVGHGAHHADPGRFAEVVLGALGRRVGTRLSAT